MSRALLYKKRLAQKFNKAIKAESSLELDPSEVKMIANLIGFLPKIKATYSKPKKITQRRINEKYHTRYLIRVDMKRVLEIESTLPESELWLEEDFLESLRQRNTIGMVIEVIDEDNLKSKIIGYSIYELHKRYIKLSKLVICEEHRRRHAGETIIEKLKSKLTTTRRTQLIAEAKEENVVAQMFLSKMGFFANNPDGSNVYNFVFDKTEVAND